MGCQILGTWLSKKVVFYSSHLIINTFASRGSNRIDEQVAPSGGSLALLDPIAEAFCFPNPYDFMYSMIHENETLQKQW